MADMVRIAHLTTVHPRFDTRIFHKECASLARHGYAVDLYVADGLGDTTRNGVSIVDIGKPRGRLGRMLAKTAAMWRRVRGSDARVIHIHDPELLPVALLLGLAGRTVIYDAHEDVPRQILSKYWIPPWARHAVAWLFERIENFVARRCALVICATRHIAERYAALGVRSLDVNNYPILDELAVPGIDAAGTAPAHAGGRTVCYVGSITRVRGAVEMVEAIGQTDATLILAGSMENQALQAELMAMPGWKRVDYRGVINRTEVRDVLAASRLGLVLLHPIPNYLDALPVKMFEYMAAGVPVLASDFPLWRGILQASGAGDCAAPLDTRQIAGRIVSMLDAPESLARMGQAGRAAVRNTYNWQIEEAKLVGAYQEILGAGPGA